MKRIISVIAAAVMLAAGAAVLPQDALHTQAASEFAQSTPAGTNVPMQDQRPERLKMTAQDHVRSEVWDNHWSDYTHYEIQLVPDMGNAFYYGQQWDENMYARTLPYHYECRVVRSDGRKEAAIPNEMMNNWFTQSEGVHITLHALRYDPAKGYQTPFNISDYNDPLFSAFENYYPVDAFDCWYMFRINGGYNTEENRFYTTNDYYNAGYFADDTEKMVVRVVLAEDAQKQPVTVSPYVLSTNRIDCIRNNNFYRLSCADHYVSAAFRDLSRRTESVNVLPVTEGDHKIVKCFLRKKPVRDGYSVYDGAIAFCSFVLYDTSRMGDVDGDGEITILDAQKVLTAYVEQMTGGDGLTPEQAKAADIDKNGAYTAVDAQYIMTYFLNNVVLEEPCTWEMLLGD